jgi:hypothetical protein
VKRTLAALMWLWASWSLAASTPMRVLRYPDGVPVAAYALGQSRAPFLFGVDTGAPVSVAYVEARTALADDPALHFVGEPWTVEQAGFLGDSRERARVRLQVGNHTRVVEVALRRVAPLPAGARIVLGTDILQDTAFRMDFRRGVFEMHELSQTDAPTWRSLLVPEKGRLLLEAPLGGRHLVDTGFHVADIARFTHLDDLRATRGNALRAHPGPHGRVICATNRDDEDVQDESLRPFRHRVTCGFEIDPANHPSLPVLGIRSAMEEGWILSFVPTTAADGARRIRLDVVHPPALPGRPPAEKTP